MVCPIPKGKMTPKTSSFLHLFISICEARSPIWWGKPRIILARSVKLPNDWSLWLEWSGVHCQLRFLLQATCLTPCQMSSCHNSIWVKSAISAAVHPCSSPRENHRRLPRSTLAEAPPAALLDLAAVLRHFLHHQSAQHPLPLTARELTGLQPMWWGAMRLCGWGIYWECFRYFLGFSENWRKISWKSELPWILGLSIDPWPFFAGYTPISRPTPIACTVARNIDLGWYFEGSSLSKSGIGLESARGS